MMREGNMVRSGLVGFLVVAVLVAGGCSRKEVDIVTAGPGAGEQIAARFAAVEQEAGMVVALLDGVAVLNEWEEPEEHYEVFRWLVQRAAETDDVEAVVSFVAALITTDESLAGEALRMLDGTMMTNHPEAWIVYLQSTAVPPAFRLHGYSLWFEQYDTDATPLEWASNLLALQYPQLQGYTGNLFGHALGRLLDDPDPARIWDVIAIIEQRIPPESHVLPAFLHVKGQALLRDARLADALAHYQAYADQLGETRLAGVVSRLVQQAAEAGEGDLVAATRAWVYAAEAFPMLRTRVARWDLEQLRGEADVMVMIAGVRDILSKDIPVSVVSSSFLQHLFYPALARAEKAGLGAIRDVLLLMDAAAVEAPDAVRGPIGTALLDVYFYLEDFHSVLTRIEQGIPGFDADWHAELYGKVQAHMAQAEGRAADAVVFYAAYIERVRSWTDPLISPEDGRLVVADEVIALNERRIGDIWKAEGETEKAAAAYERAIAYYQAAGQQYTEDALSLAAVQAALAELDAAMP